MKNAVIRQIINILAVVFTITVNALANILPFNGKTTGEVSDSFDVYFVPAGYVFSIWGLIYVGLILFAIYQALPSQRDNPRIRSVDGLFVLSCLANSVWLWFWHYEQFPLTLVAMLVLLASLLVIYLRLGYGVQTVPAAERWLVQLPFSIYLGWVSVATIANATSLLDFLGWNGWGIPATYWAVIMLLAGTIIGTAMLFTCRDIAYALVLVWAFAGIAVRQAATPLVATTAWVLTGVIAILILITWLRKR